jgi:prepilin-type N-terminal cleavage/methylation domain-containing protein
MMAARSACLPVNRRAFNLVELLIAVAIMAVLVSVLLPALMHARRASQTTVCAGHLKQLGAAFFAYVQDHQRFPKTESSPEWRYGGVDFAGPERVPLLSANRPLNAFYSDKLPSTSGEHLASFRCPADRGLWRLGAGPRNPGPSVIGDQSCYEFYGNSYRANSLLMDSTLAGIDSLARPLAEHDITVNPARLLIAGDAVWYYATRATESPESLLDASWHSEPRSGNMAAWDGSVRHVTFSPELQTYYTIHPRPAAVAPN